MYVSATPTADAIPAKEFLAPTAGLVKKTIAPSFVGISNW
jgi:hypothetical protein